MDFGRKRTVSSKNGQFSAENEQSHQKMVHFMKISWYGSTRVSALKFSKGKNQEF